jgi:hypothetical protein
MIVYPAMLQELGRIWQEGGDDSTALVPDGDTGR